VKQVCNVAAHDREHTLSRYQNMSSDALDELAARKCAAALEAIYSRTSIPKFLKRTIFRSVYPQYITFDGNTVGMTKEEIKNSTTTCTSLSGVSASSMMERLLAADDQLVPEHEVVWVNPDNEDLILSPASLGVALDAEQLKEEKRKANNEYQRNWRRTRRLAKLESTSTNTTGSVHPVHSHPVTGQTFAPRVLGPGSHSIFKQNLRKLKELQARRASSSQRSDDNRSPSSFRETTKTHNSEVTLNGNTASWKEGLTQYIQIPNAAIPTPSPYHSNHIPSPSLASLLQPQECLVEPHRLPSSAVYQQAFSQYPKVLDSDNWNVGANMIPYYQVQTPQMSNYQQCPQLSLGIDFPHRPAYDPPNNSNQGNLFPDPFPLPQEGSLHLPSHQQAHPLTLFQATPMPGSAARVSQSSAINSFGGTLWGESVHHQGSYGPASDNCTHLNDQLPFTDKEKSGADWMQEGSNSTLIVSPIPSSTFLHTRLNWDVRCNSNSMVTISLIPASLSLIKKFSRDTCLRMKYQSLSRDGIRLGEGEDLGQELLLKQSVGRSIPHMRLGDVSISDHSTSESHHYMYVEVTHRQYMDKRVTVWVVAYLSPLYA
jgi:hypothetical protein